MTELETLAKYPFLSAAREYVAGMKMSLKDIADHPVYSAAVDLGARRVQDALKGGISVQYDGRLERELAILSYAVARLLAFGSNNPSVIKKYAAAEAEHAYGFLKDEDKEAVPEIARDLGIEIKDNRISLPDYLRLTSSLSRTDPTYKLVNRSVQNGFVEIAERDAPLLVREAARLKISEHLDARSVPEYFRKMADGLKLSEQGRPPEFKIKSLREDALPPCIKSMTLSLAAGTASHNEMFILGTFLSGLGLDMDNILKVYSKSPKYDAEKTRYQLSFLTGEKGSTKYTCPGCVKIKSYGLCRGECNVKHPAMYYRDRVRNKR